MNTFIILICFCCVRTSVKQVDGKKNNIYIAERKIYRPDWEDLDTRPLPKWYDNAKIGIFIHWGVYSVPGFDEWFWWNWNSFNNKKIESFMKKNCPPGFTYEKFAPMFKAQLFEPEQWALLFAQSGAKYVVLTSKHHDGYTLFPSKRSYGWNSVEVGPKRDLVGDLAKAVKNKNLTFGVYHSLYEWYNPVYIEDKATNFSSQKFVETKLWPEIKQLIEDYQPFILWADGDWDASDKYWKSKELLAWLYNESPVKDEIVVNDRWGIGIPTKHGDFYNLADRDIIGKLISHKWENAFSLDKKSWGYRRNATGKQIAKINELLYQIVSTVSCGGNALINVGPTKEGTIPLIFQKRLLSIGKWLKVNGEAIYGSSPWTHQNDSRNGHVWYTCRKAEYDAISPTGIPRRSELVLAVYAIILTWPKGDLLKVADIVKLLHDGNNKVELLNYNKPLVWDIENGVVNIQLPNRKLLKSDNAWTLKITSK